LKKFADVVSNGQVGYFKSSHHIWYTFCKEFQQC